MLASQRSDAQPPPGTPPTEQGKPPVAAAPGRQAVPLLRYVPGSTVKVEQLIGEMDKERHQPTLSRTFTRFGVLGHRPGLLLRA